jgi:hypothetical protein
MGTAGFASPKNGQRFQQSCVLQGLQFCLGKNIDWHEPVEGRDTEKEIFFRLCVAVRTTQSRFSELRAPLVEGCLATREESSVFGLR